MNSTYKDDVMNDVPRTEDINTDSDHSSKTKSTLTYKCPNCGAGLVFDAEKQSFVCKFCISEFKEAELKKTEADKKAKAERESEHEFEDSVDHYICSSCGAEIITDRSTAADLCYYCHNPVVLSGKLSGKYRPTKILPFKFDKTEARRMFLGYAKRKFFCPRDYFSEENSEKISGVYYPFWVADADAEARLDATAFRVRTWCGGDYQYTETSRFDVKRGGNVHFEDITVSAISSEDKKMLEGILPYPKNEHIDFSIPYLQGFVAKKRDLERDDVSDEVKERMRGYSESMLRDTINGYTSVETDSTTLSLGSSHWESALMPIWILTYKKGERTYVYAMNGATGKIYGELPLSPIKLALLGALTFAAVALIGLLIGGRFL